MDDFTRRQLLALSRNFYRAHAAEFDASRGHHPWPGWSRVLAALPAPEPATGAARTPLRVLDIGCGNARLAAYLEATLSALPPETRRPLAYLGVDANKALLAAARTRLGVPDGSRDAPVPDAAHACEIRLLEQDFLASPAPGASLPKGPFDLVALFGVLHHVPGRDWRLALLKAARDRLDVGGVLALAAWRFAGRPRFARREVDWAELPPILGAAVDPAKLEPGDRLLRFGADPERPPRYCHQVADRELDGLAEALELTCRDDFLADGAEGDLNRYLVLQSSAPVRSEAPPLAASDHEGGLLGGTG